MKLIKYHGTCECGSKIALVYREESKYYNVICLGCGDYWFHSINSTNLNKLIITWDDNTVFKFLKKLYDT